MLIIMTINEQIESGISTIVLTADTAESVVVPSWASVTIDLNGFKLTGNGSDHTVINKGKLIITDTSVAKTGVIRNEVYDRYCVHNDYGANLTVNGGKMEKVQRGYTIHNWGASATINNVQIIQTDASMVSAAISNGFYNPPVENPDKVFCNMLITGGYVVTAGNPNAAVKNDEYGILTITGGTFKAHMRALNNWNDTTVTGGTFESETGAPIISGSYPSDGGRCDLTITGGTFKGTGASAIVDCSEGQSDPNYVAPQWAVSGGSFNVPVAEQYCSPGFKVEQLPDGSYGTVKIKSWEPVVKAPCGIGFMGLSSAIFQIPSIEYTAGGIEPPLTKSFVPAALISASAEGGLTGYFDGQKIKLYRGVSEASGTIVNLQLIMLGH